MDKVLAAVISSPGRIELREFPYTPPDKNCVTLKVEMCGICGTDKHTFLGQNVQYGGKPIEYPVIPGHEIVGRILEIGPREEKLRDFYGSVLHEGDRVVVLPNISCKDDYFSAHGFPPYMCPDPIDYGNQLNCKSPPYLFGGWSEIMYLLPGTKLFKVPDEVPSNLAVLAEPMAVTAGLDKAKEFSSVNREGFKFGDTILIIGAGPIGLLHVIKARMLGADDIIVLDKSDYRLSIAKELSADFIFNVTMTAADTLRKSVYDITDGRGADVVVEAAGTPEAFIQGLQLLRNGGFYIEVGNFVSAGKVNIDPHLILSKNARIIGIGGDEATSYGPSMRMLMRWSRYLPIERIISHRFPLKEVTEALQISLSLESSKIVLYMQEDQFQMRNEK
jgi:L-iditol 2-dehydrogenase